MRVLQKRCFSTLIGAVALLLLLFFSDVGYMAFDLFDNTGNSIMTMSSVTNKEVSALQRLCEKVNSDVTASADKTGVRDAYMLQCRSNGNSNINTNNQMWDVAFNIVYYNKLDQLEKQETMSIILSNIDNSSLSQMGKTKIYNFISNSDTTTSNLVRQLSEDVRADYASAYNSFRPFTGVIGWVLGVLVMGIFIMLGLTIAIDIAYIVIPLFQNFVSSQNNGQKPKYVSSEAWNAVKTAEQSIGNNYKEPLSTYFGTKTKQFLAIGLCLLYLVSGQIYNLLAMIIDSFQGIFG